MNSISSITECTNILDEIFLNICKHFHDKELNPYINKFSTNYACSINSSFISFQQQGLNQYQQNFSQDKSKEPVLIIID